MERDSSFFDKRRGMIKFLFSNEIHSVEKTAMKFIFIKF